MAKKGSWIVTVECVVLKAIVCEDCTEEQARNETWQFAVDETELDMPDWTVQDVEPNE